MFRDTKYFVRNKKQLVEGLRQADNPRAC